MDKQDLKRIYAEVEKENLLFANKGFLDNLTLPSQIIGRERKAKELVRFLLGYKQGLVVPFVSVYGRSGSGKSTIVKFVCENLDEEDISYAFVNLRKARTVFGCANLILIELGQPSLKSAQGINTAIEQISNAIEQRLSDNNKKNNNNNSGNSTAKLFVLVLDEFDVLLYDKRGKPSDFIYKLLVMEEKLREKGYLMCIVAISNNVMSDYEIDDRVRSRIGASEVFFEPYTQQAVLAILKERAAKAFSQPVDYEILQYCADQSSQEHGDARRAIDVLRVAAEIASKRGGGGEKISKMHVDAAVAQLQRDRLSTTLSSASFHLQVAATALARISYLTQEAWHSTSTVYNQYCRILEEGDDTKPLTYRRVAELLTELENMGLVISHTSSKGRHGYGTQYKLVVPPEAIGKVCFPDWWSGLVQRKAQHDNSTSSVFNPKNFPTLFNKKSGAGGLLNSISHDEDSSWNEFVGL